MAGRERFGTNGGPVFAMCSCKGSRRLAALKEALKKKSNSSCTDRERGDAGKIGLQIDRNDVLECRPGALKDIAE